MSHKGKILLVEDDESLGFVIEDNLQVEGYEVKWCKDGEEAKSTSASDVFDLCLIDIMLPKLDGFDLARHIRSINEFVPIIFLTARADESDRLLGFEIGGDDYVTKPFSMKELLYRAAVFMRRSQKPTASNTSSQLAIGIFSFDLDNFQLKHGEQKVLLTKMESQLLLMLYEKKNQLVKREDILEKIWGENDYFKGRSLDVFISRLRKYLNSDKSLSIQNHHGVGFSLKES